MTVLASSPLPQVSKGPTRKVIDLPKDSQGLFIQPDKLTPEFAIQIEHNRERMAKKWEYADEFTGDAKSYDEKGDYNCGSCNQATGMTCLLVYDDSKMKFTPLTINRQYGSCGKYEIVCSGDPELRAHRLPSTVANYGVRKGGSSGHVFGCHECPFAKPSKWLDSRKRTHWCGYGASTIMLNACCTLNGAPTI